MSKSKPGRGQASNLECLDSTQLSSGDETLDKSQAMFMRLAKFITDSFTTCMTKLTTIMEKFEIKVQAQAAETFAIANKVDQLERKVEDLTRSNSTLSEKLHVLTQTNKQLSLAVDNLEQYSRAESLLVHGLPLPAQGNNENLFNEIPLVLNRLIPNIRITPECISITHRLPSAASSSTASPSTRPPPVLVRFTRRITRTTLMQNRKSLKGQSIVLTDHLTPARATLLKKASTMVNDHKLGSAWSQDGKILVKNLQNRTIMIQSESDLSPFI